MFFINYRFVAFFFFIYLVSIPYLSAHPVSITEEERIESEIQDYTIHPDHYKLTMELITEKPYLPYSPSQRARVLARPQLEARFKQSYKYSLQEKCRNANDLNLDHLNPSIYGHVSNGLKMNLTVEEMSGYFLMGCRSF